MDTFDVEGGALEFEVEGDGPAVALVHGSVFADPWEPLLRHADLTARYRVVTYHRRGYGGSSPSPPGRTMRDEGADLVALLDHLDIDRAHAVGHSLAADIVLQAVVDAPDRFHTMTLLEPGMFTVPAAAGMGEAMTGLTQLYASGEHRQAMLLFLGGPAGADLMARLVGLLPPGAEDAALADVAALFDLDVPVGSGWVLDQHAASTLQHATMLALGSDTGPIYRETNAAIGELLAHVERLDVTDAGHFVHVEQPEQVARALTAFLERHRAGE